MSECALECCVLRAKSQRGPRPGVLPGRQALPQRWMRAWGWSWALWGPRKIAAAPPELAVGRSRGPTLVWVTTPMHRVHGHTGALQRARSGRRRADLMPHDMRRYLCAQGSQHRCATAGTGRREAAAGTRQNETQPYEGRKPRVGNNSHASRQLRAEMLHRPHRWPHGHETVHS